jgi:hypothetical protein
MLLQTAFTTPQILYIIVLFIIFFLFLCYRLFKRRERLEYVAYLAALLPFAYYWFIGVEYIQAVDLLVFLWTICLFRDLVVVYRVRHDLKRDMDFANSIIAYAVSAGFYFLFTVILPAWNPNLKTEAGAQTFFKYIVLPMLQNNPFSTGSLRIFQFLLTVDIACMIAPMFAEIKIAKQRLPVMADIFLAILFALPSIYVLYVWVLATDIIAALGLLIGVVYFIILLAITKGKK